MTSKAERKKSVQQWALWLAVGIPAAAVIIYLLIWYGPDLIGRHDIGNVTGPLRVLRLQQARDAARGRLLTLGAGIFAAGALIFTAQNYRVARRTLEVAEQGQVTDRYTKAISQVGSKKMDVRIGGIYALEHIARDSPEDYYPTVMEVLAAFIREHSPEQWPRPEPDTDTVPPRETRPDVQVALTVIGRRVSCNDRLNAAIDLRGVKLFRADLTDAHLTGVDLEGAHLEGANLYDANLTGTRLSRAHLSHAHLNEANLTGAELVGAKLIGADFYGAHLNGAVLTGAQLMGANLSTADLTDAHLTGLGNVGDAKFVSTDLSGAHLSSADLTGVDLTGVTLTETTNFTDAKWSEKSPAPEGWVRDPATGLLRRAAEDAADSGN